jgi:hypothetical protein
MPPDLCAFERRDDGLRAVLIERVVAFPPIVGSVCADLSDLPWRVLKQIRRRFGVADVVCAGHDFQLLLPCIVTSDLKSSGINRKFSTWVDLRARVARSIEGNAGDDDQSRHEIDMTQ